MTLTNSTMLKLGTQAPSFSLQDVVLDNTITLDSFPKDQPLLVMFICNHCPFVKHVQNQLAQLGKDYQNKISLVAISSNDADNYPDDGPDGLKQQALDQGFTFPYLYDQDQSVAKTYTAACTPDLFLFDKNQKLVYRGQLDDSRPGNDKPVTGQDLRAATDSVISDRPVNPNQKPSSGCNIKWKPGNEPNYFTH